MATGLEHYKAAEALLVRAASDEGGYSADFDAVEQGLLLAEAQVHATLAAAAGLAPASTSHRDQIGAPR